MDVKLAREPRIGPYTIYPHYQATDEGLSIHLQFGARLPAHQLDATAVAGAAMEAYQQDSNGTVAVRLLEGGLVHLRVVFVETPDPEDLLKQWQFFCERLVVYMTRYVATAVNWCEVAEI